MKCPCYDCKDRTIECHSTCKKYAEYVKEREAIRKAKFSENIVHSKQFAKEVRKYKWK